MPRVSDNNDETQSKLVEQLKSELESHTLILEKTELAYNTVLKVVSDKDEIISHQSVVIDSSVQSKQSTESLKEVIIDLKAELKTANDVIFQKEKDQQEGNIPLGSLQSSKNNTDLISEMEALNNKLLEEEKTSLKLKSNFEMQVVICERTEMAFNAQVELTKSKSEIIELQTTIIRI